MAKRWRNGAPMLELIDSICPLYQIILKKGRTLSPGAWIPLHIILFHQWIWIGNISHSFMIANLLFVGIWAQTYNWIICKSLCISRKNYTSHCLSILTSKRLQRLYSVFALVSTVPNGCVLALLRRVGNHWSIARGLCEVATSRRAYLTSHNNGTKPFIASFTPAAREASCRKRQLPISISPIQAPLYH